MTRLILYLIAAVVIISLLRSVIGIISKGFGDLFASPDSGTRTRASSVPNAESLKKDPVCGTFIAPSAAVQKTVGGQLYYFCSPECRDKFRG